MIYVTGDFHGDRSRFKRKEIRRLRKNDYLIICGDFGFLWDGSKKEKRLLKWIGKRRYHVLFVEGTHENFDLLHSYPETEWQGGMVREISGKLRQLCRGHIFDIDGNSVFAFGGGSNDESDIRREHSTWWSMELPSQQEIDNARQRLQARGNQVDVVVTHQASRRIGQFLRMDRNDASILDSFLDEVRETCAYNHWFFGEAHLDKVIPPSEAAVFLRVIPIPERKNSSQKY